METKIDKSVEKMREVLGEIEMGVLTSFTLADAIREGSKVTEQAVGSWGDGESACAMTASVVAAKARGYM